MSSISTDLEGRVRQSPSAEIESPQQRDWNRRLMECDGTMMQIVRTSISLIGIGFTITEFFSSGVAGSTARNGHPDARLLGGSLLTLGLLLLALGLWSQAQYRRTLALEMKQFAGPGRRAVLRYRDTPGFTVALLLTVVGLLTLIRLLLRAIF